MLFGLPRHRDCSLFENLFRASGIAKRVTHSTNQQTTGNIRQLVRDVITGNGLKISTCRPSDPPETRRNLVGERGRRLFQRRLPFEAHLPVFDARIKMGGVSPPRNLGTSRRRVLFLEHRKDGRVHIARGEVPGFGCPRPDAGLPNVSGRETLQDPLCVYDPVHNHVGYVHMDCVDYGWNVGYRKAFEYLLHSTAPREACMWAALALQIPCGKFSHMNIDPARIFGGFGHAECTQRLQVARHKPVRLEAVHSLVLRLR